MKDILLLEFQSHPRHGSNFLGLPASHVYLTAWHILNFYLRLETHFVVLVTFDPAGWNCCFAAHNFKDTDVELYIVLDLLISLLRCDHACPWPRFSRGSYLTLLLLQLLSIYLSIYIPIYLSMYLTIYLSIYLCIYLTIYISIYLCCYIKHATWTTRTITYYINTMEVCSLCVCWHYWICAV